MASKEIVGVPAWVWGVVLAAIAVAGVLLSGVTMSPEERMFRAWAQDNLNEPNSVRDATIEGPRKCSDGPLYQVTYRANVLGHPVLTETHLIIDENGARRPSDRVVKAGLDWCGFEHFKELP